MHKRPVVGLIAALSAAAFTLTPLTASASSHREAPLIAEDPLADNTDVYAFVDPQNQDNVVLAADWVPFQPAANGPNYSRFGDDVLYQIHVDNSGTGQSDITFSFRFHTTTVNPNTFLYNSPPAPITVVTNSQGEATKYNNWNRPQTYDVTMTTGSGAPTTIGEGLLSPPDVVGAKGTPHYHDLAKAAVYTRHDIKLFAGLRDDPFFIDVGGIFDLVNLAGSATGGVDSLAGLNVRSIALSIPKKTLRNGNGDPVIGVWASSSRKATTVRTDAGTNPAAALPFKTSTGPEVQVSRLGMPLTNEVIVELGRKDLFNASQPSSDKQFDGRLLKPELAAILNAVLGPSEKAPESDRRDLQAIFLTGIPGANKPKNLTVEADELRLNMDVPVKHVNPNNDNPIGYLAEGNGFPNGRRLADDVTDIDLRAVDGLTCSVFQKVDPTICNGQAPGAHAATLGDGVPKNDVPFMCVFPYIADPHSPTPVGNEPVNSTNMTATECPNAVAEATPTPAQGQVATLAQTGAASHSLPLIPLAAIIVMIGGALLSIRFAAQRFVR